MCGLEWNRWSLMIHCLTTGADVSMPAFEPEEDILIIHKLVKTLLIVRNVMHELYNLKCA